MARGSAPLALWLALAAAAAPPGDELRVTVLAGGRPQPGAQVLLQCADDGGRAVLTRARAGAAGTARLRLPARRPGDCLVWAGGVPGAGAGWAAPEAPAMELRLPPARPVTLGVVDARSGEAIPPDTVTVAARLELGTRRGVGPPRAARTLEVPSSLLGVAPGPRRGRLAVSGLPRLEGARARLAIGARGYAPARLRELPLSGSGPLEAGAVLLWPSARVCGTVTGTVEDGRTVVHAVEPGRGVAWRAEPDPGGGFCLEELPAGPVLTLWASSLYGESPAIEVLAPAGEVVLELPEPRRVAGTVLDASSGDPIADFEVVVEPAGPGEPAAAGDQGPAAALRRSRRVSDPEGRFSVPVPTDLEAVARFRAPGYAGAAVRVPAGRSRTGVEVRLTPAAAVEGRVVARRSGEPVPEAVVEAACAEGVPAARAVTDGEGRFRLEDLPAGRCRLEADAPAFAPAAVTVTLEAGGLAEGVELALPPAAAVSGRVVDASTGAPVAGASITALPAGGPAPGASATVRSGADGRFRLDELAPGAVALAVEAPGYAPATVPAEAVPPGGPEVTVELERGVTVEGVVLGALGDGAGLTVLLRRGASARTARTAFGGTFRIEDVPPGEVAFTVMALEGAAQRQGGTERGGICMGTAAIPSAPGTVRLDLDCTGGQLTVSGTVRFADGTPAAGASLRLADPAPGGDVLAATTDPRGRFVFARVRPGSYRLTVRVGGPPGRSLLAWEGDVAGDRTLDLLLPLPPPAPPPAGGGR